MGQKTHTKKRKGVMQNSLNMSVATEVMLANELSIPYAAVAISTDYDCWKEDEPCSVE